MKCCEKKSDESLDLLLSYRRTCRPFGAFLSIRFAKLVSDKNEAAFFILYQLQQYLKDDSLWKE